MLSCVLAGAALGIALRAFLVDDRVRDESKDLVRLGTALLSTLTVLVLGLLITSAKSSADVTADEVKQIAATVIQLDRNLRQYGPEASEARDLLRRMVTAHTDLLWAGPVAPVRVTWDGAARASRKSRRSCERLRLTAMGSDGYRHAPCKSHRK